MITCFKQKPAASSPKPHPRLPDVYTFLKEADERIGKTIYVGKELIYNEIIKRLENKALLFKEIDEKTGRDIIYREIKRSLPNIVGRKSPCAVV